MYTERENKEKTEENTMKKIELFEKAIREEAQSLKDYGINGTLFWAYRESIQAENEKIDFSDVIWEKDIKEIAEFLKANEIEEFTISSTFSGLITTLAEFEKHGFKIAGLTEVNARYTDWQTGKRAIIPALRMISI